MKSAGTVSTAIAFNLAALVASASAARAGEGAHGADWLQAGRASFYGSAWQGRRTASGERFDNQALTAAHSWLPFGTRVRVLAAQTGREVVVTITDRMGTARRVIDLSHEAARLLGFLRAGTTEVTLLLE